MKNNHGSAVCADRYKIGFRSIAQTCGPEGLFWLRSHRIFLPPPKICSVRIKQKVDFCEREGLFILLSRVGFLKQCR